MGVKKADCATTSRITASITAFKKSNHCTLATPTVGVGICYGNTCMLCSRVLQ